MSNFNSNASNNLNEFNNFSIHPGFYKHYLSLKNKLDELLKLAIDELAELQYINKTKIGPEQLKLFALDLVWEGLLPPYMRIICWDFVVLIQFRREHQPLRKLSLLKVN